MIVRCDWRKIEPDGTLYFGVTVGQEYFVVSIGEDDYQLFTDLGDVSWYPKEMFSVIDPAWPAEWVETMDAECGRDVAVPEFNVPGFWEDVWDGKPEARAAVIAFLRRCGITRKTRYEMSCDEFRALQKRLSRELDLSLGRKPESAGQSRTTGFAAS